jgi:hypothetical protein
LQLLDDRGEGIGDDGDHDKEGEDEVMTVGMISLISLQVTLLSSSILS